MAYQEPKDATAFKSKASLFRLVNCIIYSTKGFIACWETEEAFREELILFIVLIPTAFFLPITVIEKLLLVGSMVLVLSMEVMNSALEAVVDRIGLEINELSGRAKDMGSLAVALLIVWTIFLWLVVVANIFFKFY